MDNELMIDTSKLTIEDIALRMALGLILEVSAYPKPGNVHRLRDFPDTKFEDFLISGVISYKYVRQAILRGKRNFPIKNVYGDLIYKAIRESTRVHGGGNTHLGALLMIIPIAVAIGQYIKVKSRIIHIKTLLNFSSKLVKVYSTISDAIHLYRIIRMIKPSYITDKDDVGKYPSVYAKGYRTTLLREKLRFWDVLFASKDRDVIASEVTGGYPLTYDAVRYIKLKMHDGVDWNSTVIDTFIYMLSKKIDTMIIRKFGYKVMDNIGLKALEILRAGGAENKLGLKKIVELDSELSSKGINPGSTADIIATAISLYILSREKMIIR